MQTEGKPQTDQKGSTLSGDDSRAQIHRSVHDLRNGINTLMMNAAVLGARSADVPESLRPFVTQIGTAGRACGEELARLCALVDAYRR